MERMITYMYVRHGIQAVEVLPKLVTEIDRVTVHDVAIVCVASTRCSAYRIVGSGCATGVEDVGERGIIFNLFSVERYVWESSQAVVVRSNADCREICAAAAMIECRQAAMSMQLALTEGSGFLFPSVLEIGAQGTCRWRRRR